MTLESVPFSPSAPASPSLARLGCCAARRAGNGEPAQPQRRRLQPSEGVRLVGAAISSRGGQFGAHACLQLPACYLSSMSF